MSPVGINGVDKQGVGINGVQVKQELDAANDTVDEGVYDATTLDAVDADLAAANIKDGITIFGFLGTLSATLAEDVIHVTQSVETVTSSSFTAYELWTTLDADADLDLVDKTDTYDADSLAVASAVLAAVQAQVADEMKIRLYMDGVQVAESGFVTAAKASYTLIATRALSGEDECKIGVHNYGAAAKNFYRVGRTNGQPVWIWLCIGSIKKV